MVSSGRLVITSDRAQRRGVKKILKTSGRQSKPSLHETLYAMWLRQLVFTQAWQDPWVDMEALALRESDHVVCVGSGGCNALAYLLDRPAQVTVVDANPAHAALVKLKIAALRTLSNQEEFFAFFGVAKSTTNLRLYQSVIASALDTEARQYWEGGPIGFTRIRMFAKGFYSYGLLGQLVNVLHWSAKRHGIELSDIAAQTSIQMQADWFDTHVAQIFDAKLGAKFLSKPFSLYYQAAGPDLMQFLTQQTPESLAQVLKSKLRQLATVALIKQNYFAWQVFARRYDSSDDASLPPYLMHENFAELKASVNKISVTQLTVRDALLGMPDKSVDVVVLQDTQDWLSSAQIHDLWHTITAKAKAGARVIARSLLQDVAPVNAGLSTSWAPQWRREELFSDQLRELDRSGIYESFHLYKLIDTNR